jgi:hypothetical protein
MLLRKVRAAGAQLVQHLLQPTCLEQTQMLVLVPWSQSLLLLLRLG